MKTANKQLSPKERVLKTASDLFYRQGYHETGINQIIKEAEVSKATFYSHFPSKEELAVAYMQSQDALQMAGIKEMIRKETTPYNRFMAVIKGLGDWILSTDFRGCEFLNMASEIINPDHPIRKEVKYHMDGFRSILRDTTQDLIKSDSKYANLDVQEVTDGYFIIVNGAIASSVEYHDIWPARHAIKQTEKLIQ